MAVRQEPYIEAAIAVGVGTPVIIFRHILPNIAAPDRGAADLVDRVRDPARGVAELPRHRHPAAQAELGQHHPRRARPICSARPGRSSARASPSPASCSPSTCWATPCATSSIRKPETNEPPLLKVRDLSVEFGPAAQAVRCSIASASTWRPAIASASSANRDRARRHVPCRSCGSSPNRPEDRRGPIQFEGVDLLTCRRPTCRTSAARTSP